MACNAENILGKFFLSILSLTAFTSKPPILWILGTLRFMVQLTLFIHRELYYVGFKIRGSTRLEEER